MSIGYIRYHEAGLCIVKLIFAPATASAGARRDPSAAVHRSSWHLEGQVEERGL